MPQGAAPHKPVLLEETLQLLAPVAGGTYCDATVGYGGHSEHVLRMSAPDGRLLALDRDEQALAFARDRLRHFGDRVIFEHAPFSQLEAVLKKHKFPKLDGCLADIGVSSPQLDRPERGFSFQAEGPLDMRMDRSQGESAAELLATRSEAEIADILFHLGEERQARRIARVICQTRGEAPLTTTSALADLVARTVPRREKKNPATRTFQALRLAVNRELDELETFLDQAPDALAPGGRLAVISFHSLEDRMVKHRFRALGRPRAVHRALPQPQAHYELVVRRSVVAGDSELQDNPRARSARLRVLARKPPAPESGSAFQEGA